MLQNPEECQKGSGRHKKVGSGKFLKGKKLFCEKKKKIRKIEKGHKQNQHLPNFEKGTSKLNLLINITRGIISYMENKLQKFAPSFVSTLHLFYTE